MVLLKRVLLLFIQGDKGHPGLKIIEYSMKIIMYTFSVANIKKFK